MPTQKVPLPLSLPGTFFVLSFDRDTRNYTLFVDDDSRSSYKLGSDVQAVRRFFARLKLDPHFTDHAIDRATEWRAVQAIPDGNRVIAVRDQPPRGQSVPFKRTDEAAAGGYTLPPLT